MPQAVAGLRTDPPVSVPIAMGTSPAATAAPDPEEEPPGYRFRFHGLRAGGQGKSKEGAKSEKGDLAESYEKVTWEIQAAIKAGKITPEQGKEKLNAYKKQLATKVPGKGGVKKPAAAGSGLLELFQLVEKGELTAEEAIKKYKAARVKKEIPVKKELPVKK